ncbi:nudix hydrolase 26, chloroplastic-like [Sorghum bicolor]|uniref:nudix hydrolase 26, chloroplastic-like n=1 Tax=Sorghum bicolor TaxID=4558 RepID=UPI000B424C1F|nr:nudix hydrolase 26, chloroplastic-like [Sorghum bicolor]|eukprot:XP_021303861.1 nudix hydrolase 26, chloroplastic-like [Sorghum bicolor]
MDAPPQGYRTNIGICLADPSLTKASTPPPSLEPDPAPPRSSPRLRWILYCRAPNWLTYDFPPDVRDKLNARWGTDWKGQAQKW